MKRITSQWEGRGRKPGLGGSGVAPTDTLATSKITRRWRPTEYHFWQKGGSDDRIIFTPASQNRAQQVGANGNLKQISEGVEMYTNAFDDQTKLPPPGSPDIK